ncbi:MAG: hypothetical protein FJ215_11380 [Ignavibacteria bacterium]|nr:hypothetical protein [Ignavibacteria bacterium]
MQKRGTHLILSFCALLTAQVQGQSLEEQAVNRVQSVSASILDSTLSNTPFADWLAKMCGDSASVEWELNDCGEQTGDPSIDKDRDIPACVGVTVTLRKNQSIGISILVGTHRKGLIGNPTVYDIYLASAEKVRTIKRLSEIPSVLRQSVR